MPVHASINSLEWESEFFNLKVGLLDFSGDRPLHQADFHAYDIVQAKLLSQQTAELDELGALGFRLVEGEADFVLGLDAAARPAGIRIARAEHIPVLRSAAGEAFAWSRFRSPWYKPGESSRFYARWIENAVLGTFDHQCLLAVDDAGNMQGFISLRELSDGSARVGLLATLPASQGLGVGQRLLAAASDWCRARRLTRLHVATQLSNLPALRLYQRCGGVIERTAWWLYR